MRSHERISARTCMATALASSIAFAAFDLIRLDLYAEYATGKVDIGVAALLRLTTLRAFIDSHLCQLSARPRVCPRVAFLSL